MIRLFQKLKTDCWRKSWLIISIVFIILAGFSLFPGKALAQYQTAGSFISTNLLPATGAKPINSFTYTATVPSGTSLRVQFSPNKASWYNSSGTLDGFDTLSSGTNTIDLSARGWNWPHFYYRMVFVSNDGTNTPVLDSITLSYTDFSGTYYTYNTSGTLTSTNLLSSFSSVNSFSYSVSSLPPNTSIKVQFSQDNTNWYNSSGTAGGWDTLSFGSNTIDLSGLGWTTSSFYYQMQFTSDGSYTPVLDEISLNFTDTTRPTQSNHNPANGSTITDPTPTITLTLDENGDCRASLTDESYDAMSDDIDCTGDGTQNITCQITDLGADGTKNIYIACQDSYNNKDTAATNTDLTYTLDTALPVPTVTGVGGDAASPWSTSDTTPEITLTLDENGDCRAGTTDESYDAMSDDVDCTGDGTQNITCQMGAIAEGAAQNIYVSCQDTYNNKDTAGTNEDITAEIDATPPTITITSVAGDTTVPYSESDTTPELIFTTNEIGDCYASTDGDEAYDEMADDTDCTTGTGTDHQCTLPDLGDDGTKYIYLACQDDTDSTNNKDTADTNTEVIYTLATYEGGPGGGTARPRPPKEEEPPKPSEEKPSPIPERIGEQLQRISERAREIIREIAKLPRPLIPEFLRPGPPEEIVKPPELPPVEEVVTKEAPLSMKGGWTLLPEKPIKNFVLAPLPKAIRELAGKFPELGETFERIGITKVTDVKRLMTTQLTLQGLTKTLGLPTTKVEPGKFALAQGVPVAQLSPEAKQRVPTEIVFAKTGGELIDYNITLSVTEKGKPEQRITTISNKPLQLAVKPEAPAKSVKGYLVFKSKPKKESEIPEGRNLGIKIQDLTASLIFSNPVFAQPQPTPVRVEEELVLLEFEYADPDGDGIYTAEIQSPAVEGEYELITVIDYEDPELGRKAIRLITVVDPEGYVYRREPDGVKARIPNAIVSLYWLNRETNQYELWPAKEYQQENPQVTDDTGKYSFLVPEGVYYLKVEAPGYLSYEGESFKVKEGSGIHQNVELKKKYWWLRYWDWKTIIIVLMGLMFALLLYNFYRDKIRERRK